MLHPQSLGSQSSDFYLLLSFLSGLKGLTRGQIITGITSWPLFKAEPCTETFIHIIPFTPHSEPELGTDCYDSYSRDEKNEAQKG